MPPRRPGGLRRGERYGMRVNSLTVDFWRNYPHAQLDFAPADKVRLELGSPVSPCVILPEQTGDESFLYLVLPVRLKAGE